MKICLLNDSFPPVIDGVANVVANYAKILSQGGDQVIVGTPRYPEARYEEYPFPVVPYWSLNTAGLSGGYRAGNPFDARAVRQLEAFEPELIHAHSPVAAAIQARVLRGGIVAPFIYTYHTKYDIDIARLIKLKPVREESIRAIVSNISAADEVWTVSRGAGENLESLGYTGTWRVMHNGVDFPRGRASDEAVREAVAGQDLPADVPLLLYVGRIVEYKGLPLLLDALKILKEQGTDFRMVFIGKGPDREKLEKRAEELGLTQGGIVRFAGAVSDREVLRAWNTRADLFVFPSTFDTNGLVVREAAACGLPALLIKGSCAAEDVTDGVNGFTAEETAADYARVLKEICRDRAHLAQVGRRAMEEIYLSWEDAVAAARVRYGEILEESRSGRLILNREDTMDKLALTAGTVRRETERLLTRPRELWDEAVSGLLDLLEEDEPEEKDPSGREP